MHGGSPEEPQPRPTPTCLGYHVEMGFCTHGRCPLGDSSRRQKTRAVVQWTVAGLRRQEEPRKLGRAVWGEARRAQASATAHLLRPRSAPSFPLVIFSQFNKVRLNYCWEQKVVLQECWEACPKSLGTSLILCECPLSFIPRKSMDEVSPNGDRL